MEQDNALNVAIVGDGPRCKAIMDEILAEELSQRHVRLIGVACTSSDGVGYHYARAKGVYTTTDYRDLYKFKELHMIIELTGRDEVADNISRTKPDHVRLASRLLWDTFQIEEEMIADRERAEEELRKHCAHLEELLKDRTAELTIGYQLLEQRILERKGAEERTKLAYAELNQIFQTAADGMCVIDRDFNVLRVNETFSSLSGMSEFEAVGKKCYEVFPGPLCHTPECAMSRILCGEDRVECEDEKERSDRTKIPCTVRSTPLRGSGGEVIGIVEQFRDISQSKRAEEQRDKLIARLQGGSS